MLLNNTQDKISESDNMETQKKLERAFKVYKKAYQRLNDIECDDINCGMCPLKKYHNVPCNIGDLMSKRNI